MKNKKIVIAIIAIIAVVMLGIKGKGLLEKRRSQVENEPLPKTQIQSVSLVKAKEGVLQNRVSYIAQVLSNRSIKLSTKLAGYIEEVFVSESQAIKKGDLLVRIDSSEIKSSIKALEMTLLTQKRDYLTAKKVYNRNKKLYDIGGLSQERLELSSVALSAKKSAVENSVQKLSQLKHQLSYLQITAPFDGYVESIFLHRGDLATAAKPILSLSDGKKKLLFAFAPVDRDIVKKQDTIFIDGKESGSVKTIYTTSKNGLVTAEGTLERDLNLPSGSSIEIEVLTKEMKGCVLPQNTILHKKDATYIMIYKDRKFLPQKVNILMEDKQSVMISDCPSLQVANASEVKLAKLPALGEVDIRGAEHE